MKSTELRIGNLVRLRINDERVRIIAPDSNEKVSYIHIKDISTSSSEYTYSPIPLTEEWLLKFGFDKIFENKRCDFIRFEKRISRTKTKFSQKIEIEHHYTKRKREIWTSIILRTMCMDNKGIEHCSFQIIPRNIKSVHSLQNLYFALTGEELIYNE
tara:strand:+ start:41 stop:511 length:471 start_codon:yes stop_codon:yes gene_type:complete